MKILVLNCGSSSIKYQVIDMKSADDYTCLLYTSQRDHGPHLSERNQQGATGRVSGQDRAADFRNDDVVDFLRAEQLDAALDFIRNVRNDLHGLADVYKRQMISRPNSDFLSMFCA